MIYDEDKCKECGAARVPGSRLCVGCLIKRLDAERAENLIKKQVIEGLRRKNEKLTRLCERLLDHITSQVIYAQSVELFLRAGGEGKKRGIRDEKSRVHDNTEK